MARPKKKPEKKEKNEVKIELKNSKINEISELNEEFDEADSSIDPAFFGSTIRRSIRPVNPSLDINPITDLETGLDDIPVQTTKDPDDNIPAGNVYNAPQYGSNYSSNAYTSATSSQENTSPSLFMDKPIVPDDFNFRKWQESTQGFPARTPGQDDNYMARAPDRLQDDNSLPFQDRKNKPRF